MSSSSAHHTFPNKLPRIIWQHGLIRASPGVHDVRAGTSTSFTNASSESGPHDPVTSLLTFGYRTDDGDIEVRLEYRPSITVLAVTLVLRI